MLRLLDSLFVGSHFRLDDFHFVGVSKPAFYAVKTGGIDTVVHHDVMILDGGDSAFFNAWFLPYDGRYKEHEREYRDEYREIDLPRFLSDSDGFLDSLYRWIDFSTEPYKLMAPSAEHQNEEVDFLFHSVTSFNPLLSEIGLGILR